MQIQLFQSSKLWKSFKMVRASQLALFPFEIQDRLAFTLIIMLSHSTSPETSFAYA
jgi:hypothetical protein